jgi:nitroreductase
MFIPLIQKRRSIRRFLKRDIEPEKIDLLVEAALWAPSSRGLNPWEFIVVTERETLDRLSMVKIHGSSFLNNANLGIVVCADPEKCDVWVEDASIASIFIHLAALSLGLGSCWIQIRERMHNEIMTSEEYISGILNIPVNLKVESIVAVGYPDEEKPPHTKEELQYEKVHNNVYGTAFGHR